VDLGATMGERLIFQASLGYCIALAVGVGYLYNRKLMPVKGLQLCLAGVALLAAFATISRNAQWKNNDILFVTDVLHTPQSVKTNNAASTAYVALYDKTKSKAEKKMYFNKALYHLDEAEKLHPQFTDIYMNRGSMLWREMRYADSETEWNKGRAINPNHNKLLEYDQILCQYYMAEGVKKGQAKEYDIAIEKLQKATTYGSRNAEAWYNLGGVAYMKGDLLLATNSFEKCLNIDPNHAQANQALGAIKGNGVIK
jgi:tetratricopeptide (TPR) repeat protein